MESSAPERVLRSFAFILLALPAVALAQTTKMGYAFDDPRLLAAQRAWGIIHATRLLARACAQAGDTLAAEAWAQWQEREFAEIEATAAILARHHFAAESASQEALSAILGLPIRLDLSPAERDAACATLPAALASGRYDLQRRRQEWLHP